MRRLTFDECPKTEKAFIEKMRADRIFKARVENMGFTILFDRLVFPDGRMARKSR